MTSKRYFGDGGIGRLIVVGRGPHVPFALKMAASKGVETYYFSSPRLADDEGVIAARSLTANYCERARLTVEDLEGLASDGGFLLSMGSPFIFSQGMIELFSGRMVNLHGGPLPRFRGGGTYSWHILMNVQEGASTIHTIVPAIDAGDIVSQHRFRFPDTCRFPGDFLERQWQEDLVHLGNFLPRLFANEAYSHKPQDEEIATYFPRLHTATHGFLDLSWPIEQAARFIRAFSHPYQGAASFIGSADVRLYDAEAKRIDEPEFHPFQYGLVLRSEPGRLEVAGNGGRLVISEFSGPSEIKVGDRLHTPRAILDSAMGTRVKFAADGTIKSTS